MSHHAWVERVIHFPYFLLRRASRTPLLVAVLILSVLGFGLGEPEANAGANGVVVGIASAGPMITSPAMLRDIGRQIRRSTEQPGPITSPGDAAGIGVPVLAKGKWSNPQIYADLPDILSNPAAALGKLRAGDKGLPGMLGGGGAENWMKRLDEMIGGREGGGLGERLKQFQIPR